jgi:hypothetical protein
MADQEQNKCACYLSVNLLASGVENPQLLHIILPHRNCCNYVSRNVCWQLLLKEPEVTAIAVTLLKQAATTFLKEKRPVHALLPF